MIVSAMLAFMGISGFFGKINLSKLELSLEFPKEIYAHEDIPVKIYLKNNKRFIPSFLIRVRLLDKTAFFPVVDRKSSKSKYLITKFTRRGINTIGEVYLCSIFPFNFFIRCKSYKINKHIIVFPQPRKCTNQKEEKLSRKKGEKSISNIKGYHGDIISVRDYYAGDPLKYIHWKASAKTGVLKTKELTEDTAEPMIIDFKNFEGHIEQKISCITYLILSAYKKGIPVGLKINGKFIKPTSSQKDKFKMLRELALYGQNKN